MRKWIVAASLIGAGARAQSVASRISSPQEQALLTQLIAREDARDQIGDESVRTRGLASTNPFIRAFTVRGLGRLERAGAFEQIANALVGKSPEVRAAAADAMAQSVARPMSPRSADAVRSQNAIDVARARMTLMGHLESERDPGVRAALLESIGRLPQGSVDQVKATA